MTEVYFIVFPGKAHKCAYDFQAVSLDYFQLNKDERTLAIRGAKDIPRYIDHLTGIHAYIVDLEWSSAVSRAHTAAASESSREERTRRTYIWIPEPERIKSHFPNFRGKQIKVDLIHSGSGVQTDNVFHPHGSQAERLGDVKRH